MTTDTFLYRFNQGVEQYSFLMDERERFPKGTGPQSGTRNKLKSLAFRQRQLDAQYYAELEATYPNKYRKMLLIKQQIKEWQQRKPADDSTWTLHNTLSWRN